VKGFGLGILRNRTPCAAEEEQDQDQEQEENQDQDQEESFICDRLLYAAGCYPLKSAIGVQARCAIQGMGRYSGDGELLCSEFSPMGIESY